MYAEIKLKPIPIAAGEIYGLRFIIAFIFFLFWLGVLYAGADHPPPQGFIQIVLFDLLASCLLFLWVVSYVNWSRTRSRHRFRWVFFDGISAGLLFGILAIISPYSGENAPQPSWSDYLIWLTVLAIVGTANTTGIYFCCSLYSKASTVKA